MWNRRSLFVLSVLIVLSSCEIQDPFAEYRGTNLIAGSAFAFSAGLWEPESGSTYVGFAAADCDPPAAGVEVYRLELRNLLPDGDFEQTAAGDLPSGWLGVNGPTCKVVDAVVDGGSHAGRIIAGSRSLYFWNGSNDQIATFDLRGYALDQAPAEARYLFRFSFRAATSVIYGFYTDATVPVAWSVASETGLAGIGAAPWEQYTTNPIVDVPRGARACFFTVGAAPNPSVTNDLQECYIDGLQMVRMDLRHHLVLSLAYGDPSLPLVSGTYRFRLKAKADPSAGTAANRFAAGGVVLGITRTLVQADGTEVPHIAERVFLAGTDFTAAVWSELAVTLDSLDVNPDTSTIRMTLYVVPADDTLSFSLASGSLLIAAPALEMLPDGS